MAVVRKGIAKKDGIINKSHLYYYQIQQQAFVAERNWCDFVVRGSNKELFQQQVPIYYGIVEGEIRIPLELFWLIHFTRISITQA